SGTSTPTSPITTRTALRSRPSMYGLARPIRVITRIRLLAKRPSHSEASTISTATISSGAFATSCSSLSCICPSAAAKRSCSGMPASVARSVVAGGGVDAGVMVWNRKESMRAGLQPPRQREQADHREGQAELERHPEQDAQPGAQADPCGVAEVLHAQPAAMQQFAGQCAHERPQQDAERA